MADVNIQDNRGAFLAALKEAKKDALEIIGQKAETYAKGLAPTRDGALRNSIAHTTEGDKVIVGSNAQYAPYVELGTGNLFEPPPEWLEYQAQRGRGFSSWIYFDPRDGKFHLGLPQEPRPYIRPAIEEHREEYKEIWKRELENAKE